MARRTMRHANRYLFKGNKRGQTGITALRIESASYRNTSLLMLAYD